MRIYATLYALMLANFLMLVEPAGGLYPFHLLHIFRFSSSISCALASRQASALAAPLSCSLAHRTRRFCCHSQHWFIDVCFHPYLLIGADPVKEVVSTPKVVGVRETFVVRLLACAIEIWMFSGISSATVACCTLICLVFIVKDIEDQHAIESLVQCRRAFTIQSSINSCCIGSLRLFVIF